MDQIASFHLVRERQGRQPLVLWRLWRDRRPLRAVDGLESWRLLGTAREDRTAPGADLRRSALFAVWRDRLALDAFMSTHAIAERWDRAESWHVTMRTISARGSWNDRRIPVGDGVAAGRTDAAGPVVVLTRAAVRARYWWAFARMSRRVDRALRAQPGLRAVVGIGEAPLGRVGTLSVWDSAAAARSFAAGPRHQTAQGAERSQRWFGEELFAWFEPIASSGTWDGWDPVPDQRPGRGPSQT